jgi:hypothetical protein
MIFGFNTDVKASDNVVYHVQSEARVNDLLLQTQVFVKGHCIGKRASSYAELAVQPNFSTEEMHELLKSQHKMMLEGVKTGKMQDLFCSDGEVQDANATGLAVKWLNSDLMLSNGSIVLKLLVNDHGKPADGALLTSRLSLTHDAHIHSQSMTETDGTAELEIEVPGDTGSELTVLVRAKSSDEESPKSVTRKFRIKRA